jgi:hypothetical protein
VDAHEYLGNASPTKPVIVEEIWGIDLQNDNASLVLGGKRRALSASRGGKLRFSASKQVK